MYTKVDFRTRIVLSALLFAAYNDVNNIDFRQYCVHIRKYINKRMAKNLDMCAIVKMERPDVAPAVYAQIQCCQPTSAAVEPLCWESCYQKIDIFLPTNVERYLCLHFNKL